MATGQQPPVAQDLLELLQTYGVDPGQQLGPGMIYIALRTPVGTAVVDPFSATQDSATTQIMRQLGVELELGFGAPPPALVAEEAGRPLGKNLMIGAGILLGLAGFRMLGAGLVLASLAPGILSDLQEVTG